MLGPVARHWSVYHAQLARRHGPRGRDRSRLGTSARRIPTTATAQQTEPGRYWVFFAHNRASLQPDAEQVVAEAAQSFLRTGSTRISLVGSADSTGAAAYNQKLSERRAETVRAELVRLGVPAETITVRAEGENAPIVPTPRGVPEARNRYVAIDFPEREALPPVAAATPEPPPPPPPAPPEPPRFSAQLGGFSGYNLKENDSGNTNTNHLLGLQLTLGYLATPNLELNLSQAGFHSLDGNDDGWGGRSTAGLNLRANYGALHPYIGANLGGIYGKGVQDGPLAGPESASSTTLTTAPISTSRPATTTASAIPGTRASSRAASASACASRRR